MNILNESKQLITNIIEVNLTKDTTGSRDRNDKIDSKDKLKEAFHVEEGMTIENHKGKKRNEQYTKRTKLHRGKKGDKGDKNQLTKAFGTLTVDVLELSETGNKLKPFPSPLSFSPALPGTTM